MNTSGVDILSLSLNTSDVDLLSLSLNTSGVDLLSLSLNTSGVDLLSLSLNTSGVDLLSLSLRPLYLPRQFGQVFARVVYIPFCQAWAAGDGHRATTATAVSGCPQLRRRRL